MRFAIILVLACQPYFAVSFLYGAVPSVLRQNGASLETVGLFGLVFFAFTVNFLWTPIVDRWAPFGFQRRRFWLFSTQLSCVSLFFMLAFLDPARHLAAILMTGMVLAGFAATQRSVILGFSADVLDDAEKPWGATAFGWGTALGNIIGGALGLWLVDHFGWSLTLTILSACMLIATPLLLWAREPSQKMPARAGGLRIVADRRAWVVIAALVPATFGLAVAFAMTQPRLVDIGFDLTAIGVVAAVGNLVAATFAGPLAGWLATWLPLSRLMAGGATVIALTLLLLLVLTHLAGEWTGALVSVIVVFSAICALGVFSNTLFLKIAGEGDAAATEVTFLSAIMSMVALAGFMASGFIATWAGYGMTLMIAAIGGLLTAFLFTRPSSRKAIAFGGEQA